MQLSTSSKGNWLRTGKAEAALSHIGFAGCASRACAAHSSVSVTHRFLRRGYISEAWSKSQNHGYILLAILCARDLDGNHAQIIGGQACSPNGFSASLLCCGFYRRRLVLPPASRGREMRPGRRAILARRGSAYGTRPKMTEVCTFADRTDARKYEEDFIIVLTINENEVPDCWSAGHPRFTP
jgi:hypothetical protein